MSTRLSVKLIIIHFYILVLQFYNNFLDSVFCVLHTGVERFFFLQNTIRYATTEYRYIRCRYGTLNPALSIIYNDETTEEIVPTRILHT